VSLDLDFDDGQAAIAESLGQLCVDRCSPEQLRGAGGALPEGLWRELGEFGVLAIATTEGEGGALELCAAMEALGDGLCPGPLVATVLAGQLFAGEDLRELVEGRALVAAGEGGLFAWGDRAKWFLERRGDRVQLGTPRSGVEAVGMLGGEPWGRTDLDLGPELEGSSRACCLADVAHAAYLAAASQHLLNDAAEHARVRKQFGRAIGEFQAVAHPLADCSMQLAAARSLSRAAAFRLDEEQLEAARDLAAAARLSAAAAGRDTAHVAHQVFGAIGITLEGPAFQRSRRVQQLATAGGGEVLRERVLVHFEAAMGAA
jgi:alkylation response protein AidB-like acyl-CoA dehydrogenase